MDKKKERAVLEGWRREAVDYRDVKVKSTRISNGASRLYNISCPYVNVIRA